MLLDKAQGGGLSAEWGVKWKKRKKIKGKMSGDLHGYVQKQNERKTSMQPDGERESTQPGKPPKEVKKKEMSSERKWGFVEKRACRGLRGGGVSV